MFIVFAVWSKNLMTLLQVWPDIWCCWQRGDCQQCCNVAAAIHWCYIRQHCCSVPAQCRCERCCVWPLKVRMSAVRLRCQGICYCFFKFHYCCCHFLFNYPVFSELLSRLEVAFFYHSDTLLQNQQFKTSESS